MPLAFSVSTLGFSRLSAHFSVLTFSQQSDPIIVTIGEPGESELNGLADVLLGSLGLTGVLVLASVVAAGVFAGVLFWIRSRAE